MSLEHSYLPDRNDVANDEFSGRSVFSSPESSELRQAPQLPATGAEVRRDRRRWGGIRQDRDQETEVRHRKVSGVRACERVKHARCVSRG